MDLAQNFSLRLAGARVLALSMAGFLAACATPVLQDGAQLGGARIAILTPGDSAADGAEAVIQLGDAKTLPLTGHVTARIEAAWAIGAHRLVLLSGATRTCPRQESLLTTRAEAGQWRVLGKCQDRFATSLSGEQWSARQINARDPINWVFRDGVLSGPLAQSALHGRRNRATAVERPAESERPADPAREPSSMPDPVSTPPVSRPVGDDVVPAPVGAGPLPRPAAAPPRLF